MTRTLCTAYRSWKDEMALVKSISVSAPAKVILFGEHAVVYGTPAIAGAVDRRTHVQVTQINEKVIRLKLDTISLEHTFPLPLADCSIPDDLPSSAKNCLKCCLIIWSHFKVDSGASVVVTSDFPLGAGLGSSASFSVSMSAAVVAANRVLSSGSDQTKEELLLSDSELQQVFNIADHCERVFHGNPSGIDAATCALGGIIRFQKGVGVEKVAGSLPIKLAIVDSKVDRNTGSIVQGVRDLKNRLPTVMSGIINSMQEVAEAAVNELHNWSGSSERLLDLVKLNQGLLYAIGVSHPALEKIGHSLEDLKVGFKLTGAGGGGNAIVFIPPEVSSDDVVALLSKNGYEANIVSVGVKGLEIFIE